jgi:hypothetical protein
MDTIMGISKNAAKKRRQRENRTAASSATPDTIAILPAIIAPNLSTATATVTNNPECPDKAIEDLWRKVAGRAAKKAWQDKYVKKQMRLRAEAQLATPSNAKPAAAVQANPADSDTATLSANENAATTLLPVQFANSLINIRQEVDNYYCKQLLRTAPIAVYTIVEPQAILP